MTDELELTNEDGRTASYASNLPVGNTLAPAYTSSVTRIPSLPVTPATVPTEEAFYGGFGAGQKDRRRGYQISSERLNDQARDYFSEYIRQDKSVTRGHDPKKLLDSFVQQYRVGYFEGAKKLENDLLDDEEDQLYQQVYRDKERDVQRGDALVDDALLVRAIEQALQRIGIRSAAQKQAVVADVSVYVKAYQVYRPSPQSGSDEVPGGQPFRLSSDR